MSKRKKQVEEFFANYESLFNNSLSNSDFKGEGIAQSFEDFFIESSPQGVTCLKNDSRFLDNIRSAFDFYRNIGSKGMSIVSKEITVLDDLHAMAKIYWRYSYTKGDKEGTIDFTNFYFVTMRDQVKIFSFIAGDEQKALAEKGLMPEGAAVPSQ
jgi:hypothetical protein